MADVKKATGLVEITERDDAFLKFKLGIMTMKAWKEGFNACETSQEEIEALNGKFATAEYIDVTKGNITHHNVVSLKLLPPEQAAVIANGAEPKDRRITRVAIAKSLIEAAGRESVNVDATQELADWWFNWVWEVSDSIGQAEIKPIPERSPENIQQSQDTLIAEIMSAAESKGYEVPSERYSALLKGICDSHSFKAVRLNDLNAGQQATVLKDIKEIEDEPVPDPDPNIPH